jgi:hypothetical protein
LASSRDFNKLVIKATMHAKTFFFEILLFENTIWIFFRETWPYAWKQNIIFFMFWQKPDILIPNLYLYSIKIQTNIDQNTVKYLRKITYFFEIFFEEIFFWRGWAHPGPYGWAGPSHLVTGPSQWPNQPCTRKILRVHGTVRR